MTWPSLRLTRRTVLWLLVVTLVLLAIEAWYPFRPELPLWRPSAPERSAEGVTFGGDGDRLASPAGMDWVAEAAATDRLAVRLEARTGQAVQQGPARLLAVSENHFQADLMVGQDGDDLVVRLRRPGSDPSGDPPFRVDDVFADDRWKAARGDGGRQPDAGGRRRRHPGGRATGARPAGRVGADLPGLPRRRPGRRAGLAGTVAPGRRAGAATSRPSTSSKPACWRPRAAGRFGVGSVTWAGAARRTPCGCRLCGCWPSCRWAPPSAACCAAPAAPRSRSHW